MAEGVLPARAAARYLTVLARANAAACVCMVEALKRPITDRETLQLYQGWKRAGPQERARIVEQPELFLRARAQMRVEAAPRGDPVRPLLQDVNAITEGARSASRRVDEGLLRELSDGRRGAVRRALTTCRAALGAMFEAIGTEEEACSTATPAQPS